MQILEESQLTSDYKEQVCHEFLQLNSPELIEKVYECSRVVRYKAGEYVFREGESITEIPILVKGVAGCYSFCKDGTEMLNCLGSEINLVLDCGFDMDNPQALDNLKVIEESDILMIPLEVIREAGSLFPEVKELIPHFYRKYLKYQMTFAKNRGLPIDQRVESMMNFQPGLWKRIPEKCKAQILNIAPEHWTRYKKQHGL